MTVDKMSRLVPARTMSITRVRKSLTLAFPNIPRGIPDVDLPQVNIERLDPAMVDRVNAFSDNDVFEEPRVT